MVENTSCIIGIIKLYKAKSLSEQTNNLILYLNKERAFQQNIEVYYIQIKKILK